MAKARPEVPAEMGNLAEKAINQAEKPFGPFFRRGEKFRTRAEKFPSSRSLPSGT
jgi:hypothetical protein